MSKKIKKLFIANRGEICRRIALSANGLGIPSATLTGTNPPPAFLAEVIASFKFVEDLASKNYLDHAFLIQTAKELDCNAVHPGYGFLSENAAFAEACQKAGLIWVGPSPKSMAAMASKSKAREIAAKLNVPVTPALNDPTGDGFAKAAEFGKKTGYPLLVKAALGGGGKGMRMVEDQSSLKEAMIRCHSEAKAAFGDGSLIIERYIVNPRHVEVQILADQHGNTYAIGDRDCSMQRRHQKIVEEAPAPRLDEKVRREMHAAALNLAKQVKYDSTGTMEFLVGTNGKQQEFFFLEMNTRLQVEHPVTEEICGLDLVHWQLRIANGEALPDLNSLPQSGRHSIEARIYAEDPANQFLPCPGPVYCFQPSNGPGIRWEVGLDRTDEISTRFDPMIAKCVATAESRLQAIDRLVDALKRTMLAGPQNNLIFLIKVLQTKEFRESAISTHFLADNMPKLLKAMTDDAKTKAPLFAKLSSWLAANVTSGPASGPPTAAGIFQRAKLQAATGGNAQMPTSQASLAPGRSKAREILCGTGSLEEKPGISTGFNYVLSKTGEGRLYWLFADGQVYKHQFASQSLTDFLSDRHVSDEIKAPVPGKVVDVKIKPRANIEPGAVVLVLESMKMEYEVKSGKAGQIAQINVKAGDQVKAGEILATWEKG